MNRSVPPSRSVRRPAPVAALAAAAASVLAALLAAAPAAACEVCLGAAANGSSALVTGARLGVLLLLGITGAVLGGLTRFFFYLRNRARQAEIEAIDSEWAQLQRSSLS